MRKKMLAKTIGPVVSAFIIFGHTAIPAQDNNEQLVSREALRADIRELSTLLEETHPDPYLKGGGKIAFHKRMQRLLREVPETGTTAEGFYRMLLPFLAALGDGHTRLLSPYQKDDSCPGGLPLYFKIVERELMLTAVHEREYLSLIGSRLISLEGVLFTEIKTRQEKLFGFENEYHILDSLTGFNSLWWKSELQLLLPEWRDKSVLNVALKLPDGGQKNFRIPVPKSIQYPLHSLPSKIRIPSTTKSAFNFGFTGNDKKTAILRIDHMSSFRERFEILRSMGRTNIGSSALNYYKQFNDSEPPEDIDRIISGLPSATELFLTLLTEMKKARSENLLIDLRKNNGGSSAMADILIYLLYGEERLLSSFSDSSEVTKYSALYFKLHQNESIEEINKTRQIMLTDTDYDFSKDYSFSDQVPLEEKRESLKDRIRSMPSFERVYRQHKYGAYYRPRNVYVLCSTETFSSGFTLMHDLHSAGAKIVGNPSSQAPNCFGSIQEFELSHSKLRGHVSHKYYEAYPDDPLRGKLLIPDFPIAYEKFAEYDFDPNSEILFALELLKSQ